MYSISFVIFNERRYKDPYAHFILFFYNIEAVFAFWNVLLQNSLI